MRVTNIMHKIKSMIEKMDINLIGLAAFTSPLMIWITSYSGYGEKLYAPAFVILEALNILLLSRAISGAKKNEAGAVLGFAVALQAVIITLVVFMLPFCL